MLDKFGLVSSAGGGSDSKNLGPGLAAERRVRILVKMEQGGLNFLKDGGPVVVAEGRKLPRVIVQFFPFGRVRTEGREVQVGRGLRGDENKFVRVSWCIMNVVVVVLVLFIFVFGCFFSDDFVGDGVVVVSDCELSSSTGVVDFLRMILGNNVVAGVNDIAIVVFVFDGKKSFLGVVVRRTNGGSPGSPPPGEMRPSTSMTDWSLGAVRPPVIGASSWSPLGESFQPRPLPFSPVSAS